MARNNSRIGMEKVRWRIVKRGGEEEVIKEELSQEKGIGETCSYCKASCDTDDNYCWKCGKRLSKSSSSNVINFSFTSALRTE